MGQIGKLSAKGQAHHRLCRVQLCDLGKLSTWDSFFLIVEDEDDSSFLTGCDEKLERTRVTHLAQS